MAAERESAMAGGVVEGAERVYAGGGDTPSSSHGAVMEIQQLKVQLAQYADQQTMLGQKIEDLTSQLKSFKESDVPKASVGDSMERLAGFNKKDMVKPKPFDMEPEFFLNWAELG